MIDILQALHLLNWETGNSDISDQTMFWIRQIQDPGLEDAEKKDILSSLSDPMRSYGKASEQAEILVNCAVFGYKLNLAEDALGWLESAERLFTSDTHRLAVIYWIKSIILRAMGRYQSAFDEARCARRLFFRLADQYRVRKQVDIESWYCGQILEMTCDLISSPEDMFEWMYEFHGTLLCPPAAQIKDRLAQYLERQNFSRVDESMQLLLGISLKASDPMEAGEALAYCGVIHWLLDNRTEAIEFFQSAMTQFIPGSHEYALVRWMLGLALFVIPSEGANAISHMEASIQYFEDLHMEAIHQNKMDWRDWYEIHHSAMKRVLREQISGVI